MGLDVAVDVGVAVEALVVEGGLATIVAEPQRSEADLGVEGVTIAEVNLVDELVEVHEPPAETRPHRTDLLLALLHGASGADDQAHEAISSRPYGPFAASLGARLAMSRMVRLMR